MLGMISQRMTTTVSGYHGRRITDPAEVADLVHRLEPRSIQLSAALNEHGVGWKHRLWAIEDATSEVCALVSVSRWVRDRWQASPLILDSQAGPAAAAIIDRSPAWGVVGALQDVKPVFAHLTRRVDREPRLMAFFSGAAPIPEVEYDDPRIRFATKRDLANLYALYEAFEADAIPTRPRVKAFIRECLARGPLLVAADNGVMVGALRIDARSPDYLLWGGLTVVPESRGKGIANSLVMTAIRRTRDLEIGACMVRATTNPMSYRQLEPGIAMGVLEADIWSEVALRPPLRFRGQGRSRKLLETIEGRAQRRQPEFDRDVGI
jgi:GNAT superfamily N-acetyltransferase